MNLAGDLEHRAQSTPQAVGIIDEADRSLTYGQWLDLSSRMATWLEGHGVNPGDRVALYLHNSLEQVVAIFGAWMAGAVPVSVSALYNARELGDSLDKTSPVLVLTDVARSAAAHQAAGDRAVMVLDEAADAARRQTGVDVMLASIAPRPHPIPDRGEDEAVILFTGGTTGQPKAVAITHGGTYASMVSLARASRPELDGPAPTAGPEVSPNLILLPLFHGGGLQSLLFALHLGRRVVLMKRFDVARLETMVNRYEIDNLFLMPTMIFDLVHAPPDVRLEPVNKVLVAGQALDPLLRVQFEDRYGVIIFSNYGSAEMGHVAGWTPRDVRQGNWKPGSVGRVYDGVEVEIRGEDGRRLPPGEHGEICVRTERTKGYVDERATSGDPQLVVDGWVHSGDVGYVDEDGVLFLVGRRREMIKTGGFQVWPAEIESELRQHPDVQDVAVVGVQDDRLGEVPKAFVVPRDPTRIDPEELTIELIRFSRERLAHFKQLRAVSVIDRIPRSEAGKVQREALLHT